MALPAEKGGSEMRLDTCPVPHYIGVQMLLPQLNKRDRGCDCWTSRRSPGFVLVFLHRLQNKPIFAGPLDRLSESQPKVSLEFYLKGNKTFRPNMRRDDAVHCPGEECIVDVHVFILRQNFV